MNNSQTGTDPTPGRNDHQDIESYQRWRWGKLNPLKLSCINWMFAMETYTPDDYSWGDQDDRVWGTCKSLYETTVSLLEEMQDTDPARDQVYNLQFITASFRPVWEEASKKGAGLDPIKFDLFIERTRKVIDALENILGVEETEPIESPRVEAEPLRFKGEWYFKASNKQLDPDALRKALHRGTITGIKPKGRNQYDFDSVCSAYPRHAAILKAHLERHLQSGQEA